MKFYASVTSQNEVEASCIFPPYRVLMSYHYFKNKKMKKVLLDAIELGYEVFLDSGAFSAKYSGYTINLKEYCEFIVETKVCTYAALDVIGDAKATLANTEYMVKEFGLSPIPTFHMGSNPKDLRKLFDYPYIALGGFVSSSGVLKYCNEVWGIILREKPDIRVHGFAQTNIDMMARYPWFSIDSTSFKICKRYGRQQVIWGEDFYFKIFEEGEYIEILRRAGHKDIDTMSNKDRHFLYDHYAAQSYKTYTAHLKELNKTKDFSYLTSQQQMF